MSPAAPEDFADALRVAMNRRPEMSNGAVARAAGIDESHLYKLMRGGVEHPQPRTVKRLAEALDAPELLELSDPRQGLRARLEETEQTLAHVLREVDALRQEVARLRSGAPPQNQEAR